MLQKTLLLIAVALLSSCATTANVAVLPLPPELIFPSSHKLTEIQDNHLFYDHNAIYNRLGRREQLLLDRIETLKGIISVTQ